VRSKTGFTIVETLVALVVLTLGLLTLSSSGFSLKQMLDRASRSQVAGNFGNRRLELLRPAACAATLRSTGSETLRRGSATLATNTWWFEARGRAVLVRVATSHVVRPGRIHVDTLETAVLCAG
jgi:hypothetical protein